MPVPLIIAGVGAAAKVGASMSEGKAMRAATAAQERASNAALAHEREREAISDKRYDQKHQDYLAYVADWKARHGQGPVPGAAAATPSNMDPATIGAVKPGGRWSYSGDRWSLGAPGSAPQTLQDLAGAGPMTSGQPTPDQAGSMADVSAGQGRTLQDLSQWNDWRTRGLGV